MACPFGLELWGADPDHLQAVAEVAFEELERLELQLSAYIPASDVCWLNATAASAPARVEPELFDLLMLAARLHVETGSAFDITAGPLNRCWGFYQRSGLMPDSAALAQARERVGMQHVHLDPEERTVAFDREGVEINLGAIGKGYALRRLVELIGQYEVEAALIHSGGSTVAAMGAPPEAAAWRIGIVDPWDPERRLGSVRLKDRALSTSGQLEQSFVHEGRRYGHILDPRTGEPAAGMGCAWVLANDPAEADALSTALFVLGPDGARNYSERHPDVAAYLLTDDQPPQQVDLGLRPTTE